MEPSADVERSARGPGRVEGAARWPASASTSGATATPGALPGRHGEGRPRDPAGEPEPGRLRRAGCLAGRQPEPVSVVMESSGHYWLPLASHLLRPGVQVSLVNPLEAKYFAKSRLARTKSDPADARNLAEMGMRARCPPRDPLAGVELRQAARFAMTLVTEQARVCQRLCAWSSSASPSSASCSTIRPAAPHARCCGSRRPPGGDPPPDLDARQRQRRARPSRLGQAEGRAAPGRRSRPRSRCPSSSPRSPSRSGCCSTSSTSSSARSRPPTGMSRACSTASPPSAADDPGRRALRPWRR